MVDSASPYIATYLIAGFIWCIWNINSKFFSAILARAYEHENFIWVLFGFLVGSVLWPIGLVSDIIIWLSNTWRGGKGNA